MSLKTTTALGLHMPLHFLLKAEARTLSVPKALAISRTLSGVRAPEVSCQLIDDFTADHLADELGPDNIRCNMVVPSWMWGPAVEMFIKGQAKQQGIGREEALQEIVGRFPLRRMTEDGEVADVVAFFASDLAKAVTGQYLLVNAGEMSR